MSMEEEFISKEDDKATLVSDYEQMISSLNSEIAYLKSKQSIVNSYPKIDQSTVLKEENSLLHSEIKSYKSIKTNLEQQISKLKIERHQQKDNINSNIRQLEEDKEELLSKLKSSWEEIKKFNSIRQEFEKIIQEREKNETDVQKKVEEM